MARIDHIAGASGSFVLDRRDWRGGIGRFLAETAPFLSPSAVLTSSRKATHPLAPVELAAALRGSNVPFFSHGYVPPLTGGERAAVTLHDLMYLRGHSAQSRVRAAYMTALKPLYRRCASVVTMSDAARDDVAEWLGGNVNVVAVGGGVGPQFHPAAEPPTGPPAVLYVGSRAKNKNVPAVVGGFARSNLADAELWLSGSEADWAPFLTDVPSAVRSRVKCLGRIDDADLPHVYGQASVVLIPSIEEGYGLPALEAMACGIPVVHSTDRALREVVGDTGIEVDPHDWTAIAEAIDSVVGDPTLSADLSRRGLDRASTMTWEAVAARIADIVGTIDALR